MIRTHSRLTLIFLAFLVICFFSNCTAIGFGVGLAIDKKNAKGSNQVPLEQLSTIKKGETIKLVLRNGVVHEGQLVMLSTNEHAQFEYIVWKKNGKSIQERTALEDIDYVMTNFKQNKKWAGLGLGFVADVLFFSTILPAYLDSTL